MNTSLITELFLYYARFPNKKSLAPLFNKGESIIDGYADLKNSALNLPDGNICPDIDNFVFGPNFDTVSSYVNNMTGYYLFVDFGEIECTTDRSNRFTDSARLAITVAYRLKEFNGDMMEQLIASDSCLNKLIAIRNTMIRDQRQRYWLKDVSKNHTLSPFIARELSSIGWSMLFNRDNYDGFNIKQL